MENVTLLPHLGTAALEVREAMGRMALDNVIAFAEGRAICRTRCDGDGGRERPPYAVAGMQCREHAVSKPRVTPFRMRNGRFFER
jgi:hypothetical protein